MVRLLSVALEPCSIRGTSLVEIYDSGWQCAFATRNPETRRYSRVMPWVHCKDYLNDVVWSNRHQKPSSIYGMSYFPEKHPMKMDRLRLLVRDKSIEKLATVSLRSQCLNSRRLLRCVERRFGFQTSVLKTCKLARSRDKKTVAYLFEADKRWLASAPVLSLFSLLCRVGRFFDWKKYGLNVDKFIKDIIRPVGHPLGTEAVPGVMRRSFDKDRSYLRPFTKAGGFDSFPVKKLTAIENKQLWGTEETCIQNVHDCGIVSFSSSEFSIETFLSRRYGC